MAIYFASFYEYHLSHGYQNVITSREWFNMTSFFHSLFIKYFDLEETDLCVFFYVFPSILHQTTQIAHCDAFSLASAFFFSPHLFFNQRSFLQILCISLRSNTWVIRLVL